MFKNSYRNKKREVASWILSKIVIVKGFVPTARIENNIRTELNYKKTYDYYELDKLAEEGEYGREIIYEAAYLLISRNHADILENTNNIYLSKICATTSGEIALKEEDYEEEIRNNKSDKVYRVTRWLVPVFALLISLFSLYISFKKPSNLTVQLAQPTESFKNN